MTRTEIRPATMDPMSPLPARGAPALYGDLWRGVPRELGFLLLALPVATVGFTITSGLFSGGIGTLAAFLFGVVVLVVALYVSRWFGLVELRRLEWAGRPKIARPNWQDAQAREGFLGWLSAMFANGHYWLYLLHTMVINFFVSLVSWTVTVAWLTAGVGGVTFGLWRGLLPPDGRTPFEGIVESGSALSFVGSALVGLVLIATLPLVTHAFVLAHDGIARGVLGAFKSEALRREVTALTRSRGAAASAEGHSLRRLERDIHDGPQQRFVRLQMDLAAADRQIDTDPALAHSLVAEAMQQAREALEELRALSRGFAPPILLDRGLVAALDSAATRSPIPTHIENELPSDTELPQEIERNAYFAASEALANAAKHSRATSVWIRVSLRRIPEADDTWLDVAITDDGRGGAVVVPGHGLAGLDERLRGLGGVLEIDSPIGGPTSVAVHIPVT